MEIRDSHQRLKIRKRSRDVRAHQELLNKD